MLTVRLHGHLEEKFGSEFKFAASTVREVIDALQANFDDFTEEFIKDMRTYNILVDAEAQEINACSLPVKTNSTIDIVPVIGGAGFLKSIGKIIIGALLLFVAVPALLAIGGPVAIVAAFALAAISTSLILSGVSSLLAGPDGPDGGGAKSSSLTNLQNIVGQGMPMPIGYGRLMIGSVVISATASSSYTQYSDAATYENLLTGQTVDVIVPAATQGPVLQTATDTRPDGYQAPAVTTGINGGYSAEQAALIYATNSALIGNGTYEVVNYTLPSGTTIATPTYRAPRISGQYNGDSAINKR